MKKTKFLLFIVLSLSIFFIYSCSKDEKQIKIVKQINQTEELISTYVEAKNALEIGDYYLASKKFLEAEILFPQSQWAPKSLIMASYSYYLQDYYNESIRSLKRYLENYPNDKNLVYARYLLALNYFELIEGEKRDIAAIFLAKEQFQLIVKNFPNTEYALDSRYKINLLNDLLAAKEIYLGRYYIKKQKWIPALNRFKEVIDNYETTIYVEEAIHRMVEINYKLGLVDESKKYSSLLVYNYQSSQWYKETFKIFNKNYSIPIKQNQKNKKGLIKQFKNFFNQNE